MIKRIGMAARKDIEALIGHKVNLSTYVRVEENWRDSLSSLKSLGYSE